MPTAEAITQQIRQSVDLIEIVSQYVALKRAGKDFKGLCPFHKEKTPSFQVSPSKQIFKCFGCGAGGDVFTFLQLYEKITFPEARRLLAQRAGISLRDVRSDSAEQGKSSFDLASANAWALSYFRRNLLDADLGAATRQYLDERGISVESSERFELGLALDGFENLLPAAMKGGFKVATLRAAGLVKDRSSGAGQYDTFRHRLIFPIRDMMNRVIGFGGRTMGDDPAKYLNSPQSILFDKSRCLYGLWLAKQAIVESGKVIAVEGYTDCIMASQFGFANTVATMGTAMTDQHMQLLKRYADEVILVFDSDEAGQRAADRAIEVALMTNLNVRIAVVTEGKDPCDYLLLAGAEAFSDVLNRAPGALEFKWSKVRKEFDAESSNTRRREAIEAFVSAIVIATSGTFGSIDKIQLGFLGNHLAPLLRLDPFDVHRLLQDAIRRVGRSKASSRSGQSVSAAGQPDRPGVEQRALVEIFEVLLSEPAYWADAREVFDPAAFVDEQLRRLATEFVGLAETPGDFQANDIFDRFEDPSDAQRLTDLMLQGECRGNYEATFAGAVARIREVRESRKLAQLRQGLADSVGSQDSQTEEEILRELTEVASRRRGFAPVQPD